VARAIHQKHLPVVLLQDREMTTLRWQMAFAPALSAGVFDLQGVAARRVRLEEATLLARRWRGVIPLVVGSMRATIDQLAPTVIVDACIKGEREPIDLRSLAPLTIGVGPRFSVGGDVDLVIESAWGARLGAVIAKGGAERQPCKPEIIDGLSWERFARAPKAGIFRTNCRIGETVQRRSVVGTIEDLTVTAPISGTIRGLVRDGTEMRCGDKFVEIDPRSSNAQYTGVGERPAKIAAGVLNAIRETLFRHDIFHG
jgi:xanthine dehydrogenase accessory factor